MARYARPLAVTFLSASTLAYEILLVRIFAIEQFHHFAYMAIGIAMLGFGASGTLVALSRPQPQQAARWFVWAAVLTPAALVASAVLVHQVPLDATQLPWDAGQWPRLALVYLLLALPFGVGALATLVALTLEPQRTGWIYGASFLGAGVGAALAVAVLWIVFPLRALAVPALVASLGAISAVPAAATRKALVRGCAWASLLLAVVVFVEPLWRLDITPYKGLPQVEAFPDARRVAQATSPLGWVVAVEASAFRHAPGLSLAYTGAFPAQTALFVDAEIAGAVSDWGGEDAALAILDWLPSALPYALGEAGDVLVVGAGGGLEVWNALAHGARRVKALELNPQLVRLGGWLDNPAVPAPELDRVEWAIGDARGYVARSRERFDLITVAAGRALGTAAAGVHALNEDFLHTAQAYVSYLERLSDQGVLAITRWLTVPPRENVRVILTATQALRRHAPGAVAGGLVVARSWATGTVLVKPSGFSDRDVELLAAWARVRRFDLDWHPGIVVPATAFNVLDEPTLFRAAAAAVAGPDSAARFAAAYPFDVAVADDARPYPHHFLRAGALRSFLAGSRGSWLPFAEWGYVALLATLVQSVVLAALLMLVPAALRARGAGSSSWLRLVGYFSAIGLAYLAAEVAAIQQLDLLLGHPVYAVAAVLSAFLICSGVGSAWSDRQPAKRGWIVGALLAGMLVLYGGLLLGMIHLLQPTQLLLRAAAALSVLAPLAFLMGMPFPLGLRSLAGLETGSVAWAWAANGFSSVLATPLAALIALESGSRTLFLAAAAAYAGAALLHGGYVRLVSPSAQ